MQQFYDFKVEKIKNLSSEEKKLRKKSFFLEKFAIFFQENIDFPIRK